MAVRRLGTAAVVKPRRDGRADVAIGHHVACDRGGRGRRALTDRVARPRIRCVASDVKFLSTLILPWTIFPTVDTSEADAGTVAATRGTIRIPVHERLARTANVRVQVGP